MIKTFWQSSEFAQAGQSLEAVTKADRMYVLQNRKVEESDCFINTERSGPISFCKDDEIIQKTEY